MTTSDALSLTAGLCGLLLTVGGLYLLMRGTIDLSRQSLGNDDSPALCFQFKGFKLIAQYPAIAIFAVGLLFLGLAIWTNHDQTVSITVTAQLEGATPQEVDIYAAVPLIPVASRSDGTIEYKIPVDPNADTVWVLVVTPGHDPPTFVTSAQLRQPTWAGSDRVAALGPLKVGRAVKSIPTAPRLDEPQAPLPGAHENPGKF